MEQPLISIALCTYNGEKFLADQIDSILEQSWQNLEIIIVDDCSTDQTFDIAQQYAGRDQRIKCFCNKSNLGFNKNFEKAIKLTTGSFIAISDQDDVWQKNKLQVLHDHIDDNWLIFSNSAHINTNGIDTDRKLLNNFKIKQNYKALLLNNYVTGHTTLFKRGFLNYILPFPSTGFYDWWMGFVALYHHRLGYADQVLTQYREHCQAITNLEKYNKIQRGNYFFKMTIDQLKIFAAYPVLTSQEHDYIHKLYSAFLKKGKSYSAPLFKIIMSDYSLLFAHAKKRKNLSRLNFAFRTAKKQKGYKG